MLAGPITIVVPMLRVLLVVAGACQPYQSSRLLWISLMNAPHSHGPPGPSKFASLTALWDPRDKRPSSFSFHHLLFFFFFSTTSSSFSSLLTSIHSFYSSSSSVTIVTCGCVDWDCHCHSALHFLLVGGLLICFTFSNRLCSTFNLTT